MHPRIAFWGTPELTVEYLDALTKAGMQPVVVITNPDRPKGRGHEVAATPAKLWALAHGVPVLTPHKLDDAFFEELKGYDLDVSIVVAYGSILQERFISLPKHATLNVHYSLLPKFRGASPVESSILAGDTETGSAIQVMAPALDSGPIIATANTFIDPDETAPDLRERLTAIGSALLVWTLPDYLSGKLNQIPQDTAQATVCRKMQKSDGLIDPAGDSIQNYRKYRAYAEWPRTYFFIQKGGKAIRVIVTEAHMQNSSFIIDRVLPEGKKEVAYSDFLRNLNQ